MAFSAFRFNQPATDFAILRDTVRSLYQSVHFNELEKPGYDLFERAMIGFYKLKCEQKLSDKDLLTIIDFRKSANEKRLWTLDLKTRKVLFHTLVAHGQNTGEVFAEKFSNRKGSHQSSLGFYVTKDTYIGKHGISLKLHGAEPGINDLAEARAIVMHGADYVSEEFIERVGRLGRSHGCPAVPAPLAEEIVTTLAGNTCLFIYYPEYRYLAQTAYYNPEVEQVTSGR